jgi:hypothetical protein
MQIERSKERLLKGNFENKMEKIGKGYGARMSVRRHKWAYFRQHVQFLGLTSLYIWWTPGLFIVNAVA